MSAGDRAPPTGAAHLPRWLQAEEWHRFSQAEALYRERTQPWPAFGPAEQAAAWREHVTLRGGQGPKPVRLGTGRWILPPWPPTGQPPHRPLTPGRWAAIREHLASQAAGPPSIPSPGASAKRARLTPEDRDRITARIRTQRTRRKG